MLFILFSPSSIFCLFLVHVGGLVLFEGFMLKVHQL